MKVLMVNKFFYIKGGSETYYFALKNLLEQNNHEVIDFSMIDEKNFYSEYSDYFVKHVDYNTKISFAQKISAACNIIYSKEAKKKFEELVIKTKPDIVHLHIFQHQISPSILDVIKKYDIPTVYTAHELKMICPNYKMFNSKGICEKCKNKKYYNCIINKCVKCSFMKSIISCLEAYIHSWRKSYGVIDKIITPSLFYKKKFEEFGVDSKKIVHIPNFLERTMPTIEKRNDSKTYFIYVGRLSEEKGILTLVKAAEKAHALTYIVGTGPLNNFLYDYIAENDIKYVKMLGHKSGNELINLVANSIATVLPSEWYENGPYSAIEALQVGSPIIGTDIGGIPELVSKNGYLFSKGNVDDLSNILIRMKTMEKSEYILLEKKSKELFNTAYSAEIHYEKLMKVYESVLKDKGKIYEK